MKRTIACGALMLTLTAAARAGAEELIIKNRGDHPSYRFEAEPHGLVGFGGLAKKGDGGGGFRGT